MVSKNYVDISLWSYYNSLSRQIATRQNISPINIPTIEARKIVFFLLMELAAMFKQEFSNLATQLQKISANFPTINHDAEPIHPSQTLIYPTPPQPQSQQLPVNEVPVNYHMYIQIPGAKQQ